MGHVERLRAILARPGLVQMPGCHDALSARMIERAGFEVAYMSGFGTAASRFGLPDTGLVGFREMADQAASIAAAIGIPLIADADTGYGNEANVRRTVRTYARAGVAGIQIEDQVWPKRCGHTEGKSVVPLDEAVTRIRAAVDARAEGDIVIVARTDARAVHGHDAAMERCRVFADAGADVIFPEAPESREELASFAETIDATLLVNVLEGGKTPILEPQEYEALGFDVAIYPLTLLFATARALRDQLGAGERCEPWTGPLSFDELREIVGFDD